MNEQQFTALIVDDEPAVRRLTVSMLSRLKFSCDEASDGNEARSLIADRHYDVVVTDLLMPKRHGHTLALELLSRGEERPLIVVLTGVLEPRLAEDLIARGVDEVEFKPVDFAALAAKIRARCEERICRQSAPSGESAVDCSRTAPEIHGECLAPQKVGRQLEALTGRLPFSPAAIDLVHLIKHKSSNAEVIAECIARDPGLSVELLKIANSSFYNPSGKLSGDLHSAILRLGHRKIGELAMAGAALQIVTESMLPWVSAEIVWRRCLASAQALEYMHPAASLGADDESLFISAMLVPASRVFLAAVFPKTYERLIQRCEKEGVSLSSLERETFEYSPHAALANCLAKAGLPTQLCNPLRHASAPPDGLVNLPESERTTAERLHFAGFLADLVVGHWAPWDEVGFPPAAVTHQASPGQLVSIIDRLRADLARLEPWDSSSSRGSMTGSSAADGLEYTEMRYFRLLAEHHDLLATFMESLGVKLVHLSVEDACSASPMLVNCMDVSDDRVAQFLENCQPNASRVLVGNGAYRPVNSLRGHFVTTPCSFAQLQDRLRTAVTKHPAAA